jgi:hypothetical protein
MAYRLRFGTYDFPASLTYNLQSFRSATPSGKRLRAHGARVPVGRLAERRVEVRGLLKQESASSLQDQLDALRAAVMSGPAILYLPNDRHLRNVQKDDGGQDRYENTWPERLVEVAIDLITGDPYLYRDTQSSDLTNALSSSPETVTVNNAFGSAPAAPELRLTVGGSGEVTLAATLTNTTTGEAFTLSGEVAGGDIILINSLTKTVLIGATDRSDLFDGLLPTLALGNNSLSVAWTSGSLTNLDVYWNSRWY